MVIMKELSIEEKAKAYDEAINRMKHYAVDEYGCSRIKVADVFPELAESEDERIRKEIIEQINLLKSATLSDLKDKQFNSWLAWLEKQAEQKSIWHNEDEEPQRDSLILLIMQSGTPIVAKIIEPNHTFNHGERWAYIDDLLEKQGEQILANSAKTCKDEQSQKHFELKAGHWYICHRAFCCRADHLTVKEGERFMCEKDGVVKGFVIKEPEKYFKEVCAPAPIEDEQKPSWSEEDELISNKILCICYDFERSFEISPLSTKVIKEDVGKIDNWLKSLRPQSQWKPSEFQLGGLSDAIIKYEAQGINAVALKELLEQLKKLK